MKIKLLSALFVIALCMNSYGQSPHDKKFVKMVYNGDQNKPYPRIVFYTPGSYVITYSGFSPDEWGVMITVEQFEKMKMSVEQKNKIKADSSLLENNSYEFIVYENGEVTHFYTPYLPRIRQIFTDINNQLTNSEKDKQTKQELRQIISMLICDNKLAICDK